MQRLIGIFILLIGLGGCVAPEDRLEAESPEAFCKRLTRTLKGTAPETVLWPTFELVSGVTIEDHRSSRAKEALQEQLPAARKDFDAEVVMVQKKWAAMRATGDQLGVQWESLQLDSFDMELFFIDNLYQLSAVLHLSDGQQQFQLPFKDAVRIRTDWYAPRMGVLVVKP
ncbi:MAG: hypothetical protein ACFB10_14490 [Salibacteraceae bacterium]